MVSIEFWHGKISRPSTGYECIVHACAFDRGLALGLIILVTRHPELSAIFELCRQ